MKVEIIITQKDIEDGVIGCPHQCVVANAIQRVLRRGYSPVVLADVVSIENRKEGRYEFSCRLPAEVKMKIQTFDMGKDIAPFSFTLDIPPSCLAPLFVEPLLAVS